MKQEKAQLENLPHMQVPTLVIRGERDTVVPQHWAEKVAQTLPDGEFVVIDRAAHDVIDKIIFGARRHLAGTFR